MYLKAIKEYINDLLNLISPRTCAVCGSSLLKSEHSICLKCLLKMPRIENNSCEAFSRLTALAHVKQTKCMFRYVKEDDYAYLIQQSKYHSRPQIDHDLAKIFALELLNSDFFNDIDAIMAVPIHWIKKLRRGFNQSEIIAESISKVTGIPVIDNLIASKGHISQTKKTAYNRINDSLNIFRLKNPQQIEGKHILIVDDVITTGATIASCCNTINDSCKNVEISVLSLAATSMI